MKKICRVLTMAAMSACAADENVDEAVEVEVSESGGPCGNGMWDPTELCVTHPGMNVLPIVTLGPLGLDAPYAALQLRRPRSFGVGLRLAIHAGEQLGRDTDTLRRGQLERLAQKLLRSLTHRIRSDSSVESPPRIPRAIS